MFCDRNVLNSVYFLTLSLVFFSDFSITTLDKSSGKLLNETKKPLLRIKHGISDVNNEYPYVVALGYNLEGKNTSSFYKSCSGSLLSPQWVLTAAHCIQKDSPTKIRYGNMTLKPKDKLATYSNVLKRIPHPAYVNYGLVKVVNDIAMLMVEVVPLNAYGRLSAMDHRTLVGLPVIYVGLGMTAEKAVYSSKFLKEQQRKMRQFGYGVVTPCGRMMYSNPVVCLSPKCSRRKQAAIPGDSGGPVLQTGRIIGVLIRYHPSARSEATNSASPISSFLDWISLVVSTS